MRGIKKPYVFASFFFVLGMASYWLLEKAQSLLTPKTSIQYQVQKTLPELLTREDEDDLDPFSLAQRMQNQMLKQMIPTDQIQAGQVEQREDDKFVYYDLIVPGFDQNKLNVNIDQGMISISGVIEKKIRRSPSSKDICFAISSINSSTTQYRHRKSSGGKHKG